jgi:hypothetical protein
VCPRLSGTILSVSYFSIREYLCCVGGMAHGIGKAQHGQSYVILMQVKAHVSYDVPASYGAV